MSVQLPEFLTLPEPDSMDWQPMGSGYVAQDGPWGYAVAPQGARAQYGVSLRGKVLHTGTEASVEQAKSYLRAYYGSVRSERSPK